MSFSRAVLSGLVLLVTGCHSAITNENAPSDPSHWEEVHLSYSKRAQKWRFGESFNVDQPPDDAIRATVKVSSVDVPFPEPAGGGESATVTFSVTPGMLPCFPNCRRIVLRFDPRVNPFMEGSAQILVFLPDGRFWGGTSFQF